jgi:hypothetical protein
VLEATEAALPLPKPKAPSKKKTAGKKLSS